MPKLTLRDPFWLVLVAAMGCAWFADHRRQVERIDKIQMETLVIILGRRITPYRGTIVILRTPDGKEIVTHPSVR